MERHESIKAHPSARLLCTTWPVFGDVPKEMFGFEALAIIIRHLYAHLPLSYWKDVDSEPLALFQVARLTHLDPSWAFGSKLKEALLELCSDWQPAEGVEAASFARLVECDKLISHFWSREEYLLFTRSVISKSPDDAQWKEIATRDVETVARAGLVQYDGTTSISTKISSRFAEFTHPSTGHKYLQTSTFPAVIRVLYTPAPTATARFKDLQTVALTSPHIQLVDGAQGQPLLRNLQDTYFLIASVRLRAEPASPDYVRTYNIEGTFIRPPVAGNNIVNGDWELGEQGHSYMLFYTFGPRGLERLEHQTEIIRMSDRTRALIDDMAMAELMYKVTQKEEEEEEQQEQQEQEEQEEQEEQQEQEQEKVEDKEKLQPYKNEPLIPMANDKTPENTRDGSHVAPDTRTFVPPQQAVPFKFPTGVVFPASGAQQARPFNFPTGVVFPASGAQQARPFNFPTGVVFPAVGAQTQSNMPAESDIETHFSGVHPERLRNIRPPQSSSEEPRINTQSLVEGLLTRFQTPNERPQVGFQTPNQRPQVGFQTPNQRPQVGFQIPIIDSQAFSGSRGSHTSPSNPGRRRSPSSSEGGRDDGWSKKPRTHH
ncbi:hypothetical protein F4815DRAFT_441862 [Daldinia loculata]|nr:hypothetical protein F4815DRAFT_441862 [Daldinia loculata]